MIVEWQCIRKLGRTLASSRNPLDAVLVMRYRILIDLVPQFPSKAQKSSCLGILCGWEPKDDLIGIFDGRALGGGGLGGLQVENSPFGREGLSGLVGKLNGRGSISEFFKLRDRFSLNARCFWELVEVDNVGFAFADSQAGVLRLQKIVPDPSSR